MSEQGHMLLGLGDGLDGSGRHLFGLLQTLGQSAAQVLAHGELQPGIQSSSVYGKWDNVCATIEVITLYCILLYCFVNLLEKAHLIYNKSKCKHIKCHSLS
jgi:hypothetical protein